MKRRILKNKATRTILAALASSLIFMACASEKNNSTTHDLLEHGMPITIQGPEEIKVEKSSMVFQEELEIEGEDNFKMLITMQDAVTRDENKLKEEKLKSVQDHRYFFRIVKEDPQGFIYENRIDSLNSNYGFNYVRIKGDKEYVFQNSRTGFFSLEEIQDMYEAVKQPE